MSNNIKAQKNHNLSSFFSDKRFNQMIQENSQDQDIKGSSSSDSVSIHKTQQNIQDETENSVFTNGSFKLDNKSKKQYLGGLRAPSPAFSSPIKMAKRQSSKISKSPIKSQSMVFYGLQEQNSDEKQIKKSEENYKILPIDQHRSFSQFIPNNNSISNSYDRNKNRIHS